MLETIRNYLYRILVVALPEPHGGLLVGILLGVRESLSADFYNNLITTGTVHVVAASGFNVALVARSSFILLSGFLPKKVSLAFSCLVVIFYAFLAGANPAIIRAAIMGILAYLAMFFGRQYFASWSLLITVLLMLVSCPTLLDDVGFWLSVTATGGILWLTRDIQEGISQVETSFAKYGGDPIRVDSLKNTDNTRKTALQKVFKGLRSDFETTLAAQLATFPIILIVFGRISLIAPFINVMILWLIPLIMVLGCFKLIVGAVSGSLNNVLGIVVKLPLEIFIQIVDGSALVPYSDLYVGKFVENGITGFELLMLFAWYLMLIILVLRKKRSVIDVF